MRIAAVIILVLAALSSASGKGWRHIVPLHTTRDDVKRLLGVPTKTADYADYGFAQKSPFRVVSCGFVDRVLRSRNQTIHKETRNTHKIATWHVLFGFLALTCTV